MEVIRKYKNNSVFTCTPFQKKSVSLRSKRGFTLLFATLMASLLLAIATGIFNIVFKELLLTSSIKESQFAFYSADGAFTTTEGEFQFEFMGDLLTKL